MLNNKKGLILKNSKCQCSAGQSGAEIVGLLQTSLLSWTTLKLKFGFATLKTTKFFSFLRALFGVLFHEYFLNIFTEEGRLSMLSGKW